MKIISLNTWSGVVYEPLIDFFATYKDVDMFCLQEVYRDAQEKEDQPHPTLDMKYDLFERIESVLKGSHVGYFRPAYLDYYGLAMFVKNDLPIKEEGDVVMFENPTPAARGMHSRNFQYIRTALNDDPIVVVNVHGLWNGKGKTDTADRLAQSHKIREFIRGRGEQVVVMGDFNLNPDTQSLAILEDGMRNLIKEYGVTSTRTSHYPKEGKFADYALVSPGIKVKDFKVLPEEVSDHAALYLEI